MLTNITIGQYYPADSFIHRLDPRMKLLSTIIYITMLFAVKSVYGYIFSVFCLASVIKASRVPPKYMLKGLRGILYIIVITAFLNVFFATGETVLISAGWITVSLEGLIIAAKMVTRLSLLVVGSSVLTLTTTPTQFTDAIEFILKPFKVIGIPAHELAMMMTIALRTIPSLMEETDKIMKAQMARGADFDTGGLLKKAKSMVPLLVPLFISSFRRADDLATAMEARCYRGDINRTKMKVMRFSRYDLEMAVFMLAYIAVNTAINLVI